MTKPSLLFDASSILTIVRELIDDSPDKLAMKQPFFSLLEVGNALWRETFLLKRISQQQADTLLNEIYAIMDEMNVTTLQGEREGNAILDTACKLNLTFYDSAYLNEADKTKNT